jgi:hypothetical protein
VIASTATSGKMNQYEVTQQEELSTLQEIFGVCESKPNQTKPNQSNPNSLSLSLSV